jgi:la-related protein 1
LGLSYRYVALICLLSIADIAPHVYYFAAAAPTEGIQGLPFVPHPASPQAILVDPLRKELLEQIDYYFR